MILSSRVSQWGVGSALGDLAKGHAALVTMQGQDVAMVRVLGEVLWHPCVLCTASSKPSYKAEPGFIIWRLISQPADCLDPEFSFFLLTMPFSNICPYQWERRGRKNSHIHSRKFSYWLEATTKIKCMDYLWVSLFRRFLFPTDTDNWKLTILALWKDYGNTVNDLCSRVNWNMSLLIVCVCVYAR